MVLGLGLGAVAAEEPFTVRFQVSNLDNESPSEVHDFYVEVHPEWVRAPKMRHKCDLAAHLAQRASCRALSRLRLNALNLHLRVLSLSPSRRRLELRTSKSLFRMATTQTFAFSA